MSRCQQPTDPGIFQEFSRNFPGIFQEFSRNFRPVEMVRFGLRVGWSLVVVVVWVGVRVCVRETQEANCRIFKKAFPPAALRPAGQAGAGTEDGPSSETK